MEQYDFSFISNTTLRRNIEHVFYDINGLLGLDASIQSEKEIRIKIA